RNLETIFFKTFKQLLPRAAAASVACPSEVVRILQPSGKLSTTNFGLFSGASVSTYSTGQTPNSSIKNYTENAPPCKYPEGRNPPREKIRPLPLLQRQR
ncbi:hypothetical protein, partial [Marinobacter sp. DUT-1]|uniref:hypothetical protein n=1 Tax=Marinobacter sp. DUT-1 TaxID=3412037 RepID=UPI003D175383